MQTTVKTIDIQAKEWFDRTYGNSYFSAVVTINYCLENEEQIKLHFQYGYGDHYVDMALKEVKKLHPELAELSQWELRDKKGIIIRSSIQRGCLKKEVVNYTK